MSRLNLVVLRCGDIERARRSTNCSACGFSKHAHAAGPEHYAHEDEAGVLELYPQKAGAAPDATGLGFGTRRDRGATRTPAGSGPRPGPVRDNPWGRTFVVRDPDGRRIELKETPA